MARKKIALLTINHDDEAVQKTMAGIMEQCNRYDYDLAVFSPMVHITNYFKDYLHGELNIYNLVQFDSFDGVIVTPIPMQEEQITTLTDYLLDKIKAECHVPVVSVNLAFGDYDVVYSDEYTAIKTMTEHVISVHGAKKVAILTGPKDFPISNERVRAAKETLEEMGLTLPEERIYYGDFWYTSGEKLAEQIASGEVEKPDAVVCASDHMAVGLVNRLMDLGIDVPGDIVVTGNGGVREGMLNLPPVTTYEADEKYTGAEAVNRLRTLMDDGECESLQRAGAKNICLGGTCGCQEETKKIRHRLQDYMYTSGYNTALQREESGITLTTLMESYISEMFTAAPDAESCLNKIYESIYLLKPYGSFYLCLNDHWLDEAFDREDGYPDRMNMAIFSDQAKKLHGFINHVFFGPDRERKFDTKRMLPAMWDEEENEPQVYFFAPVHFEKKEIGYAVLQNPLSMPMHMGNVYSMYLRYINNALEISRAKHTILNMSERDQMTGLYNRRGLARLSDTKLVKAAPSDSIFVMMIDMNNLKLINDTLGHNQGDIGICTIAGAAERTARRGEICVRAGGDEFYIVGIGDYQTDDCEARIAEFKENLKLENEKNDAEWTFQAAVGYALISVQATNALQEAISRADDAMYVDKSKKAKILLQKNKDEKQ